MYNNKRFGVQMVAFQDTEFIETSIRLFQPFVDNITVSIGNKSWFGNVLCDGEVEKIVVRLMKEFPNIHLLKGDWKTEAEQRNANLKAMPECDYVFIVDSDEIWPSEVIHNVRDFAINKDSTVFNAFWNTRFKNVKFIIDPREPFRPTVCLNNRKKLEFFQNRLIKVGFNAASTLIPEKLCIVEHFSYVRNNDQKIKEKIMTFSHANEIVNGPQWWFENVYLQADLDSKNLHPTHPECYDHLIESKLHPEIEKMLRLYSPKLFV